MNATAVTYTWGHLKIGITILPSEWKAGRVYAAGTRVRVVFYGPTPKYYKIQPFGKHWLGFTAKPDEISQMVISDRKAYLEKKETEQ